MVMLEDGDAANAAVGCAGTLATVVFGIIAISPNADDILDIPGETVATSATGRNAIDIFTSPGPCGGEVTVTAVALGAACPATQFLVDSLTMIDFSSTTELGAGASIVCPISITLAACNGITLVQAFTLTVVCPVTA